MVVRFILVLSLKKKEFSRPQGPPKSRQRSPRKGLKTTAGLKDYITEIKKQNDLGAYFIQYAYNYI